MDWTQVTVAAIGGFAAVSVAAVTVGIPLLISSRRRIKRDSEARDSYRAKVDEIHDSTVNTHSTILRDDVDELTRLILTVVRKLESMNSRLDRHRKTMSDQAQATKELAERVAALEIPK